MAGPSQRRHRSSPGFEFKDDEELQIDNPLIVKSLPQVRREACDLAKLVSSVSPDENLFSNAGAIARDPPNYATVRGLTPAEKAALRIEKEARFRDQPKALRVTVVLLCMSAIVQGWAESIANVSNLTWPKSLGLDIHNSPGDRLVFAGINSITWFAAGILGCAFADPLQAWIPSLGRRGVIIIAGFLCLVGSIGSAVSDTWQSLMGFRVVLGCGLGLKACTTPILAAEVAPSHLRGTIVMCWQLFVAFGLACGFAASLIVYETNPNTRALTAWRWQTASIILPLMSLLTLTAVCPESPRFLLKRGRYGEAYASFCQLRQTPLQAARDMIYINAQIQVESTLLPPRTNRHGDRKASTTGQFMLQAKVKQLNYWTRLRQVFVNPRTRRAGQAAWVVMITQQLCGINAIVGYSSNILAFDGGSLDGNVPYLLNLGIGLANFVFTLPAFRFVDSRGRRFLLLTMYPIMTLTMLAAALAWRHPDETVRAGLVITFIFLFVMAYSVGQGPVAFTYASEVFPLVYREVAFGLSVSVNLSGLGLLSLLVPLVQIKGSVHGTSYSNAQTILLGSFAALNFVAMCLCYFFVPETAGTVISWKQGKINSMSLEELNYIFGVKTLRHASYQLKVMLPWIFAKAKWTVMQFFLDPNHNPGSPDVVWRWAELSQENSDDHSGENTDVGSEKTSEKAMEIERVESGPARERSSRTIEIDEGA